MDLEHPVTARLRGEPVAPRHRDGLLALLGDPRVGATLGGVRTPAEVDASIARIQRHWRTLGFGWYAWLDRETGELVARGGVGPAHIGGRDEIEVGWAVAPERWGQGLATELGAACLEVAFGPLALPDVVAFTLPHNRGSRRVMEKLGFGYERTVPYPPWGDHVLYRRHADSGLPAPAAGEASGHADP